MRYVGSLSLVLALSHVEGQGIPAYADFSMTCPLVTSCPAVCVADAADCPERATCANGTTLCADGSCVDNLEGCSEDLYSPCDENLCEKYVTCAIAVMEQDECSLQFQEDYDAQDTCEAAEEEVAKVSWTEPGFIFCYCWICIITALMIGWCAFNQRFLPVGEALPLDDMASKDKRQSYLAVNKPGPSQDEGSSSNWTQTAYKKTIVGTTIYALAIATFWGFQVLLAITTKWYYDQQGWLKNHETSRNPFDDEIQNLSVFVVVWLVGFVWSLHIKWPTNIRSLFFRRCTFNEADFIAVWAPESELINESTRRASHIRKIFSCTNFFMKLFNGYMSLLFSDVTRPSERGSFTYCPVKKNDDGSRSFTFRLRQYNIDPEAESRFLPGTMTVGKSIQDLLTCKDGLSSEEVQERVHLVGINKIHMKKPHLITALLEEFNKFFYLYQTYITWTWMNYWYYHVGLVYLGSFTIGGVVVAYLTYRNDRDLYKLSETTSSDIHVIRDGKICTKTQEELVPGDVISLSPGIASCDLVLLTGHNILVDESALTGEVSPVAKTQVDTAEGQALYDITTHKRHTIFAGTEVLECSDEDLAVVTKAGSFSSRGELLRDILFYERHRFKFDIEIEIVIGILIMWGLIAWGITVRLLGGVKENSVYTFFYGAYVFATVIPILLPTIFVVSIGISKARLNKNRIACVDQRAILVAGKVSVAFFDKTGTLTNQGLDFLNVKSFVDGKVLSVPSSADITQAMAVCHTLAKSEAGRIIGNHVDACMFEASHASMEYAKNGTMKILMLDGNAFEVVKRFEFDSHRMTQSVLATDDNGRLLAFVKGSPENIKKLCTTDSLPADFDEMSRTCAKSGLYEISIAMRELSIELSDVPNVSRNDVEADLTFIGFINFKNTLRKETAGVLQELAAGDVHSVMVTGDSVHAAVRIGVECGMLDPDKNVIVGEVGNGGTVQWTDAITDDVTSLPSVEQLESPSANTELAITGEAWSALFAASEKEAMHLSHHIKVFARCSPNDKVSVVGSFVKQGIITLMCGDGGNDCGALKTAHVGIALSDAEASVVSPFTSLDKTITSVLDVLKEGRCALASALKVYKFEMMYGMITTFNQMANAYFWITFNEWNWVFTDAVWNITLAFTLPRAKAAKVLSPDRPTASLFGPHTISSYGGILLINFLAMVIGLVALNAQDWYQCRKFAKGDISFWIVLGDNYESTVIWLITGYSYISSAMAYNFGFTHRAPWHTNYQFVFFAVAFTVLHFYVTLAQDKVSCLFRVNCTNDIIARPVIGNEPYAIANSWNHTVMPMSFRVIIVVIMVVNAILNAAWEYFFVNGIQKRLGRRMHARREEAKLHNHGGRVSDGKGGFDNEEPTYDPESGSLT